MERKKIYVPCSPVFVITGITRTTPRWLDLIRGRKVERHTRSDVGKFTGRINHTDHHPTGRFARSFPPCTDHVNHRQNDSSTPDQLTHSLTSSTFTFQTRQGCQPRGYTRLYPPNPIANLPPNSPDSYFREKKKKEERKRRRKKRKKKQHARDCTVTHLYVEFRSRVIDTVGHVVFRHFAPRCRSIGRCVTFRIFPPRREREHGARRREERQTRR